MELKTERAVVTPGLRFPFTLKQLLHFDRKYEGSVLHKALIEDPAAS